MSKICPICGCSFVPRSNVQTYCSPKCQRKSQTSKSYEAIRKRNAVQQKVRYKHDLYAAFHYKCAICGWRLPDENKANHGCQMHHIKSVADGGTNDETNLVLLCPNCHKMAHSGFISDEELYKHTFTKEKAKEESLKEHFDSLDKLYANGDPFDF